MRIAPSAAVLVLLGAGCHRSMSGAAEPPVEVAWPDSPADGFAVLPWGTRVYLEPRYGGPSARLGFPRAARPPWPQHGDTVRVVGGRDGFVEIVPLVPEDLSHCERSLDGEGFDVRLYVSPFSLASILTRVVELRFDDDTGVLLRPGAPVETIPGDPRGRWAVSAAGLRLRAPLPEDAVGQIYASSDLLMVPGMTDWELGDPSLVTYDEGWSLEIDPELAHDVVVAGAEPRSDGASDYRVHLRSRCARLDGLSPGSLPRTQQQFRHFDFGLGAPQPPPAGGAAALDMRVLAGLEAGREDPPPSEPEFAEAKVIDVIPSSDGVLGEVLLGPVPDLSSQGFAAPVFEQGTPLYLSGAGSRAGQLRGVRVFHEQSRAVGDRLCYSTAFGMRFDPPLWICLDAAEGRVRTPEEAASEVGNSVVHPVTVEAYGELRRPEVETALRRHRYQVRLCHDQALLRQPALQGELRLSLRLAGDGSVGEAEAHAKGLEPVIDCVQEAARGWSMPAPSDGRAARVEVVLWLESSPGASRF